MNTDRTGFNMFEIIHVLDDDKFIDITISLFESVIPGKSKYFILKYKENPLKYVTSNLAERIIIDSDIRKEQFQKRLLGSGIKVVFFHALSGYKIDLAIQLPDTFLKAWFVWGYDLYPNLHNYRQDYLEPATHHFVSSISDKTNLKERFLHSDMSVAIYKFLKKRKALLPKTLLERLDRQYTKSFDRAIKHIDVFVPVIPTEYAVIEKLDIAPKLAPYSYGYLDYFLKGTKTSDVLDRQHILVGNSANTANNHVDVFLRMKDFDLGDRKVYVPLSYGGNKTYIDFVLKQGKKHLGSNFEPILDLMPLEDYNKIIESCGFVIFNHIRQQGLGNIISTAYLGAKIFLNDKSPVLSYYKGLGMHIFGLRDLSETTLSLNLSSAALDKNRQIFTNNYSKDAVILKVKALLKIVATEQSRRNG